MGDNQRYYKHKEEGKFMNLRMGNVGIDSNGHGENKPKDRDLVETIRILKMEVIIYIANNEKMIRNKQHINTHIL